jgi:hypothetical protein
MGDATVTSGISKESIEADAPVCESYSSFFFLYTIIDYRSKLVV